jgi:MFS family permease
MSASRTWLPLVLAAASLMAVVMGVRQSMSLFLSTLNTTTGLGIATVSLAYAVGQLAWGLSQPIAGALTDRFGSVRVMLAGGIMVAVGTALTPYATSLPMLMLTVGILGAGGAGAFGLGVLMGTIMPRIDAARRGLASGIVNAGGSFGQFSVVPSVQAVISSAGWVPAMWSMSLLMVLALPLLFLFRAPAQAPAQTGGAASMGAAVSGALRDRSFLLLGAGFFVCGFHVGFIATHMPGVVAACGLSPAMGAWALATVGLFNIVGSFSVGWAVDKVRMKTLLSALYAVRGLAVAFFLLAPKNEFVVLLFAAVIGVTYLSTVPPTVGLIAKLHGTRYMATLFGLVIVSHQVGGFLGAWLGGRSVEANGSYDWVWYIDILLAVGAALVHLPIREARVRPNSPAVA